MTSAEDLAQGIGEVGSSAKQSGVSIQQLEGYVTSLVSSQGIGGSEAGTALKSMISRTFRLGAEGEEDAGKTEKALKHIGVEIRNQSGNFRSFNDILIDTHNKWGQLSNVQQVAIAQAIGGTHHYSKFIGIMENFGIATKATEKAMNSQNSAIEENEKYLNSVQGQWNIFKTTIEEIYTNFINSDDLKSALSVLNSFATVFKNMTSGVGGLKIAFGGLLAILFATSDTFKKFKFVSFDKQDDGIEALSKAFEKLSDHADNFQKKHAQLKDTLAGANGELEPSKLTRFKAGMMAVTESTVGQKIATVGLTIAEEALNAVIGMGIGLLIGYAVQGLMYLINYEENAKKEIEEMTTALSEQQENLTNLQDLSSQYDNLTKKLSYLEKGTSEYADTQKELRDVQAQIAQKFPEMTTYIDEQGKSYATNKKLIDDLIISKKELAKNDAEDLLNKQGEGTEETAKQLQANIDKYNKLYEAKKKGGNLVEKVAPYVDGMTGRVSTTVITTPKQQTEQMMGLAKAISTGKKSLLEYNVTVKKAQVLGISLGEDQSKWANIVTDAVKLQTNAEKENAIVKVNNTNATDENSNANENNITATLDATQSQKDLQSTMSEGVNDIKEVNSALNSYTESKKFDKLQIIELAKTYPRLLGMLGDDKAIQKELIKIQKDKISAVKLSIYQEIEAMEKAWVVKSDLFSKEIDANEAVMASKTKFFQQAMSMSKESFVNMAFSDYLTENKSNPNALQNQTQIVANLNDTWEMAHAIADAKNMLKNSGNILKDVGKTDTTKKDDKTKIIDKYQEDIDKYKEEIKSLDATMTKYVEGTPEYEKALNREIAVYKQINKLLGERSDAWKKIANSQKEASKKTTTTVVTGNPTQVTAKGKNKKVIDIINEKAKKYGVDPALIYAISRQETSTGKGIFTSNLFKNKNNPGGITSTKGGFRAFASIEDGYDEMTRLIKSYQKKGLNTIEKIGNKYAPVGADNDPKGLNNSWKRNVSKFYQQAKQGKVNKTVTVNTGKTIKTAGKGLVVVTGEDSDSASKKQEALNNSKNSLNEISDNNKTIDGLKNLKVNNIIKELNENLDDSDKKLKDLKQEFDNLNEEDLQGRSEKTKQIINLEVEHNRTIQKGKTDLLEQAKQIGSHEKIHKEVIKQVEDYNDKLVESEYELRNQKKALFEINQQQYKNAIENVDENDKLQKITKTQEYENHIVEYKQDLMNNIVSLTKQLGTITDKNSLTWKRINTSIIDSKVQINNLNKEMLELQNTIEQIEVESITTKYDDKIEDLQNKISLLGDTSVESVNEEKNKYLGEITNIRSKELAELESEINSLKQKAEKTSNDNTLSIEDKRKRLVQLTETIKKIKDSAIKIKIDVKSNGDEVLKGIKEKIKQTLDTFLKDYEDTINKMIKNLDDEENATEYQDSLQEKQNDALNTQKQIDELAMDSSLEAKARREELEKELAKKTKEINTDMRKHDVDERKKALQQQLDDKKKALEKDYTEEKIELQAKQAMIDGFYINVNGKRIEVEANILESIKNIGDAINENIIDNVNAGIEQIGKMMETISSMPSYNSNPNDSNLLMNGKNDKNSTEKTKWTIGDNQVADKIQQVLQKFLNNKDAYYPKTRNGKYDTDLARGIGHFQKQYGLNPEQFGTIDEDTLNKMNQLMGGGNFIPNFNNSMGGFFNKGKDIISKITDSVKNIPILNSFVNLPLPKANIPQVKSATYAPQLSKSEGNIELKFDKLINVEGNMDKDVLPKIEDVAKKVMKEMEKTLNKSGQHRRA